MYIYTIIYPILRQNHFASDIGINFHLRGTKRVCNLAGALCAEALAPKKYIHSGMHHVGVNLGYRWI